MTTLATVAGGADDAPAIGAPGRAPLTHAGLRALMEGTAGRLKTLGVGSGDRIAIVLSNGPEMAAAFVAVGAAAATAPLNPGYRADELEFYLSDIGAKAVLAAEDDEGPAVQTAKRLGIAVFRLTADTAGPAGSFSIAGRPLGAPAGDGPAEPGDIALLLHTSGTTSRPKLVPLSHANLVASAGHIGRALALTADDRCLNIMPLFHIHGLAAAVLSSLSAGGSVFCTPGFSALSFFGWMQEFGPSWYTAVPTMHQAILARAPRNAEVVEAAALRFIRSSSASLPPQVMGELEATFGCPVIESYGMTEAAHQMSSNPLPPAARKPGTVGIAAGPEIAVMDARGHLLGPQTEGEIVIRGANVTSGYENNPDANAAAFAHGWFHTGDQGTMDADGYARVTGRLKEIINRGGEKISPREVDEVLMDHPAIAQAVTFAMAHEKLGEEVAAAVVLREGATADERGIMDFASERLADFKVPRRVLILDEIPKGATGKLQRI
ncbi:MAG TPA: acyl--CoA ligase, partial [Devosiaceae bacterium]|nr:acyl--CoA ligase [Devosiaceae bacterium]